MQPDAYTVLQALSWLERQLPSPAPDLPVQRIAVRAMGGDEDRASRAVQELDQEGCLVTDTMGWHSGRLTGKGRSIIATEAA
jgi:hypothetical protein